MPKYTKGKSGNPGGKPKGTENLTSALRRVLAKKVPKGKKRSDLFAEAMIRLAEEGNAAAINQIFNRIDGPVKEEHDLNVISRVVVDV